MGMGEPSYEVMIYGGFGKVGYFVSTVPFDFEKYQHNIRVTTRRCQVGDSIYKWTILHSLSCSYYTHVAHQL
jgi:hypothetical protein